MFETITGHLFVTCGSYGNSSDVLNDPKLCLCTDMLIVLYYKYSQLTYSCMQIT